MCNPEVRTGLDANARQLHSDTQQVYNIVRDELTHYMDADTPHLPSGLVAKLAHAMGHLEALMVSALNTAERSEAISKAEQEEVEHYEEVIANYKQAVAMRDANVSRLLSTAEEATARAVEANVKLGKIQDIIGR